MQTKQKLSPLNPAPGKAKRSCYNYNADTEQCIYYDVIIRNHLKALEERKKDFRFFVRKPWGDYEVDGWE